MARRIFEFECANSHRIEAFVDDTMTHLPCSKCGQDAVKVLSAIRLNLEGCSGSFPTASDSWVRKRAEKLAQEQKLNS
jgi:ssDNA-binding Zn-finger/Zn-ribbon topoisomerase 1